MLIVVAAAARATAGRAHRNANGDAAAENECPGHGDGCLRAGDASDTFVLTAARTATSDQTATYQLYVRGCQACRACGPAGGSQRHLARATGSQHAIDHRTGRQADGNSRNADGLDLHRARYQAVERPAGSRGRRVLRGRRSKVVGQKCLLLQAEDRAIVPSSLSARSKNKSMSRDFGHSADATGQADGEDSPRKDGTSPSGQDDFEWPPRKDGTSPSGQDDFEWPPRKSDEPPAIEFLDSTGRSLPYRDQFNSRNAADIHVVSEQPGPAAEPPLRGPQDRATPHPIEPRQHRVSYTYGHVFQAPVERPSSPVDPPAQPLKLFPVWSRARAIPLALVGVSLIAVLEGVFIWRTTRHSSGTLPKALPQHLKPLPRRLQTVGLPPALHRGLRIRRQVRCRAGRAGLSYAANRRARRFRSTAAHAASPRLTLDNLSPGQHRVVLKANGSEVQQTVRVEAGATVSVVAPLKPKASASGWIAIESPVEVDVFADGALVGTSRSPKILLQEGEHTLGTDQREHWISREAVCAGECGHTGERKCGASGEYTIEITAVPWAEVWVDGKSVGVTPIGKMPITIGPHEVVFRHPELGEKTVSAVVKAGETTSVTVDLTRSLQKILTASGRRALTKVSARCCFLQARFSKAGRGSDGALDQLRVVTIRSHFEPTTLGSILLQIGSAAAPLAHAISIAGRFAPPICENGYPPPNRGFISSTQGPRSVTNTSQSKLPRCPSFSPMVFPTAANCVHATVTA